MVVFPNCKINLGLRIIRKREDGFHDLETVFHPLPLHDVLEIIAAPGVRSQEFGVRSSESGVRSSEFGVRSREFGVRSSEFGDRISFSASGIEVDVSDIDNLCIRAYRLLKKDCPQLPTIRLHLHKTIPIGAGLGGGSADAAFTLKLLNEKFDLKLTNERLNEYALLLGSDCPFFLVNQTCFANSRGENLKPISIDLPGYKIIIVNPGIHINTAEAFAGVSPALPAKSILEIIQQSISTWKKELVNDFEKTIFPRYPEIELIKNNLYELGAVYASMSGSGSTVYGIFEKNTEVSNSFPAHFFYKELVS